MLNLLRLFQSESDPSMGPGTPTGSVHGGCGGGGEGGGLLQCTPSVKEGERVKMLKMAREITYHERCPPSSHSAPSSCEHGQRNCDA